MKVKNLISVEKTVYYGGVLDFERAIVATDDFGGMPWFLLAALLLANDIARCALFQGGFYIFAMKSKFGVDRKIFRLPVASKQLKNEIKFGLRTMILDCLLLTAMMKLKLLDKHGSNTLFTFFMMFVWFEIWFWISHRALHHKSLFFIHRQHHLSKVLNPLSAMSFSLTERIIIVGGGLLPMAALSHFVALSYLGVFLYLITNQLLTTYIHANVEFLPSWWLKTPVLNSLNPPTHHALHHARLDGHYGLYTPFLDRLFGTTFLDYEAVHERAFHGNGLKTLSEKVTTDGDKNANMPLAEALQEAANE